MRAVDEVSSLDREVACQEAAMDSIVVAEESVDMGNTGEEEETTDDDEKLPPYATKNPWKEGAKLMLEKDYLAVKASAYARVNRKKVTSRLIVSEVKEMTNESATKVGKERTNVLPSAWTDTVHSLCPSYYKSC